MGSVWEQCRLSGDILNRPFDPAYFEAKFLCPQWYDKELLLVSEEEGRITGFIAGSRKHEFLPGETEENTPGFLTIIMVIPDSRNKGTGSALISALENAMKCLGKKSLAISFLNPVNLDWLIPSTPSHGHNNMPGIDEESLGYAFLKKKGYEAGVHEVAMYLNLSEYTKPSFVEEKRAALAEQGITAGLYDPAENCSWDLMCDRVGSEYWRKVLKDELASPSPRPILAARHNGEIIGFTGPVDLEKSGRGWFTGICTDPTYEKKGIASVLFNDLMEQFIKVGAQYSSLFTGTENHAQRLYLLTGFKPARYFAQMKKEL